MKKNDFGKYQFKLMNNSFFGKTMENLRKRVNIRLFAGSKLCKKQITKPTFVNRKIFKDDLIAVHLKKTIYKNE